MPQGPVETQRIAELIAEGLRFFGIDVTLAETKKILSESDLGGYDAVVFGSATYHGDMMQGMKTLLFLAEKANLEKKIGGAFGAFGWSGEACDRIYETMKHILKMDMIGNPLRFEIELPGGRHPDGPGLWPGTCQKDEPVNNDALN